MKGAFDLFNINSVRPIVREILRFKKAGSTLDLGSGVGRHTLYLAKHGFRVTAIDTSTEPLAALKEMARLQKLPIVVRREDVASFVPKTQFDVVLSTMVLHFLPIAKQKTMLRNMRKYTNRGGINVVSSFTDKNKKGTRPFLMPQSALKQSYEDAGWEVLVHNAGLGQPSTGYHEKGVRYWREELIARKP